MPPSEGPQKIIHVDMDAFFASVEQRDHPHLAGKPVIVGGLPESRGVVASASYEARAFGVRSAMSSAQARRICPNAHFIFPRFEAYHEASQQIREIFKEVTDRVEPLSLDEAYLDVTTNHLNEPLAGRVARWIKGEIQRRLHLTASAGVASTLFLAKIASDLNKPNGLTIIPPEKAYDFISNLPIARLWGVGPATEKILLRLGVQKASDLRTLSDEILKDQLGKQGMFLKNLSLGIDPRNVDPEWERKSYGSETTFNRDVLDLEELENVLEKLVNDLCQSLEEDEKRARTLTLKVRYSDFTTLTRSQTLGRYTRDPDRITLELRRLLRDRTDAGLHPVRLLGASVSQLITEGAPEQLWLNLPEFL